MSGPARAPELGPVIGANSLSGPLDLRLALGALGGWVASLWALTTSAVVVAVVSVVSLIAGLVALVVGRQSRGSHAFAFVACCAALVLAPLAVRLHRAHDGDLARLAAERRQVTAEIVTTGDPRSVAARSTNGVERIAVEARLIAVSVAGRRTVVNGSVLVLGTAGGWRAVAPGQRLRVDARLTPPLPGNLLTATLSAWADPARIGRPPWWQRGAVGVRSGLWRAVAGLPWPVRGLLPGLVDGDTSQLDPILAERFRVAGLTHLVAVSGTNCSIMIAAVAMVMRRMHASPGMIAVLGGAVLLGFVVVARPSPSVLRAAVMAGIVLAALAAGRQRSAMPVLAASVLLLLLWHPSLAADRGFALSVSATAALLLIAPGWAQALRGRGVPGGFAEAVAVAAAAHVITAPIVAGISGRISLVAIPANLLAEPVVAAATVLGVLAAITSPVSLPVARLFAQMAGWPCRWLVWVAEHLGALSGAALPWPSGLSGGLLLAGLTLVILVLARRAAARVLMAMAATVAVLVQIPVRSAVIMWPPPGWLVAACDIGQGDSLALPTGPHAAIIIDAGPDPVAVDGCLHRLGVDVVPLLVLTHDHLDHVGGLAGVLHGRRVERVITSPLLEPAGGWRIVTATLARLGLAPEVMHSGTSLRFGTIQLDVLGPSHTFTGSRSDPNNSSVVLRATVAGRRILLPGDAEVEAQDDLLAAGVDLRADILKVPHHGSAYSDPAFLQAVHPSLALISVGRGNDYGHPSPVLLAELTHLGIPARRTDVDGDITVVEEGGQLVSIVRNTRNGNAMGPPAGTGRRAVAGPSIGSIAGLAPSRSPPGRRDAGRRDAGRRDAGRRDTGRRDTVPR